MRHVFLQLKLRLLMCKIKALWLLFTRWTSNNALAESLACINSGRLYRLVKTYRYYESMSVTSVYTDFPLSLEKDHLEHFVTTHVTIDREDYWSQIKNHDGPVIFVAPHYGPFVLGCLKSVSELGPSKTVHTFYDSPENTPTNAKYKDILGRLGDNFKPIYNDKRGLVRALKVLKSNQILTMMPDVSDLPGQSLLVPFFHTCRQPWLELLFSR
jgi:hypothetical protein